MEICFVTANTGTLTALRIKSLIRYAVCNFIPAAVRYSIHTSSGVHTVLCNGYAMGNAGYFVGIKRPRIEADDSPVSSLQDKSAQIMAYCLIKQKNIFPLTAILLTALHQCG